MDQTFQNASCDSLKNIIVTGLGHVTSKECDLAPYLKTPKTRKFMGPQDIMAVAAAGQALKSAGLLDQPLGERAGLFLAVGYIPFEKDDLNLLFEASTDERGFSIKRFTGEGFNAISPLLTFRCLSNMPAFHISVNFDLQGPYFVTYPGPGQLYSALRKACALLAADIINVALVGAVAHQRNFLVEHHFDRIAHPVSRERLMDGAGCLILENAVHAAGRKAPGRGKLLEYGISYHPFDPFEDGESPIASECFTGANPPKGESGPCSLPITLSLAGQGHVRHELESRDGIHAFSVWEMMKLKTVSLSQEWG
ncbi:MAG: hypothetical protein HY747_07185 [Elusimicrobia bacterium]|nr:hypothetical protein [Elusimicrobiota bacterium]